MTIKTVTTNKKAYHNFHIGDSMEAGIALMGSEIKSIRDGRVNLSDSYVRPEDGELWLVNAHIARYECSSYMCHEPTRRRRLLLHRRQIEELASKVNERGLTVVPTRLYLKGGLAKVEIALAKGKKLYDKRDAISRRENERELGRVLKTNRIG